MATVVSLEVQNMVNQARKFLERYGIDATKYSDDEILEKYGKINNIEPSNLQVLSRGEATDFILKSLEFVPKGFVGQFFRNVEMDLMRAETLGWEVFINEEASKLSPTADADNRVRIADSILMYIPEEKFISLRLGDEKRMLTTRAKRNPKREAEEEAAKGAMGKLFDVGTTPTGSHRRTGAPR